MTVGGVLVLGLIAVAATGEAHEGGAGAARHAQSNHGQAESNAPARERPPAKAEQPRDQSPSGVTMLDHRNGVDGRAEVRFELATSHDRGTVYCGLFAKDAWPGLPIEFDIQPVVHQSAVCKFEGLAPGAYAAAAFHDENGNENLDLNWLGLPQEGVTFTGGVRRLIPLPPFDDIGFEVDGETTVEGELD